MLSCMCNEADHLSFTHTSIHVLHISSHTPEIALSCSSALNCRFVNRNLPLYHTVSAECITVWFGRRTPSRPQGSAAHKSVWIALNIIGMDITKVQHVFITRCWMTARSVITVFHSTLTMVSIWQTFPKHHVPIPRSSTTDLCAGIVFYQHWNKSICQMNSCLVLLESAILHCPRLGDDVKWTESLVSFFPVHFFTPTQLCSSFISTFVLFHGIIFFFSNSIVSFHSSVLGKHYVTVKLCVCMCELPQWRSSVLVNPNTTSEGEALRMWLHERERRASGEETTSEKKKKEGKKKTQNTSPCLGPCRTSGKCKKTLDYLCKCLQRLSLLFSFQTQSVNYGVHRISWCFESHHQNIHCVFGGGERRKAVYNA